MGSQALRAVSRFSDYAVTQQGERAEAEGARWPAFLKLAFTGAGGNTRLASSAHNGPLYVQKPFYPEGSDCAHIYLLHPPGGIVSGDTLELGLSLYNSANVVFTTPGATRLYRARQDSDATVPLPQKVINKISVSESSCVEWLPLETIVYDGACIELETEVSLSSGSQFCGWEITCLGLAASNIPFSRGSVRQRFAIFSDGRPCILEFTGFDAASTYVSSACGLQSQTVVGTMIAGPFHSGEQVTSALVDELREELGREAEKGELQRDVISVTRISKYIVVRYLGPCSEQARNLFITAWTRTRPVLNHRQAVMPRIWAT